MAKFRICLKIERTDFAYYEVEAKDRKTLDKMLEEGSAEDYGHCVSEESGDYNESIDSINEVKEAKNV